MAQQLRCGVSGWNHPYWTGREVAGAKLHALERVAAYFNAVEIKQTFDQVLKPEVAQLWVRKVKANAEFQFTVKLGKQFSHERLLGEEAVKEWSAGVKVLDRAGRLGAVLMQFPWSFKFTAENRKHVIALRRAFHMFPLVAEFRHESWMADEALGTLIDYKIGFCNVDQPEFVRAMPPTSFLTSAIGYVRLHGRNSFGFHGPAGPGVQRYDYDYSHEELQEWCPRIERLRAHSQRTFVIANNDNGQKAAHNMLDLASMLGVNGPQPALVLMAPKKAVQVPMFGVRTSEATRVARVA